MCYTDKNFQNPRSFRHKLLCIHLEEEGHYNFSSREKLYFRYILQKCLERPIASEQSKDIQKLLVSWMIKNKSSADDEDVLEMVDGEQLEIMVDNVDNLLVYFYDNTRMSNK